MLARSRQVANPNKTVLLIDGDSSFNMTLNDLGTVKEHNLPLKMAIMNDGRQQMVHVWQHLFFNGRLVATDNVNPDYKALAEAYGIEAIQCDNASDLPEAIERFCKAEGPVSAAGSRRDRRREIVRRSRRRRRPRPRRAASTWQILADFHCVPDICLPMVAPGKGLDEMFLPGTLSLDKEGQPKMEGMAPS